MKLIMENWRIFLEQERAGYASPNAAGAVIDLPGGDSEEDKEYRKMVKYRPQKGLPGHAHYSETPENTMSAEHLLKYLKKLSKKEPHPERLRNSVRYLVKKYCKNSEILKLFNELEDLPIIQATKELAFLSNERHIENWSTLSHRKGYAGTYAGHGAGGPAEINIYNTGIWQQWWGWDKLVEETFHFIKSTPDTGDPLRSRARKRYSHSIARNYNRFLTLLKALSVSIVYVHEMAHAVDPQMETRSDSPEIYATTQTLIYIDNLEKNILNDIFSKSSALPGNFNSWGTDEEFVSITPESTPIVSILSRKKVSPKIMVNKSIKKFINYHKEHEIEYQKQEIDKSNHR